MTQEEWKVIPEAYTYAVSNLGRVMNTKTGQILKLNIIGKTPTVNLQDAGSTLCRSVPKLVRQVFGP